MQILRLDFDRLQHFSLHLQLFWFLNQSFCFCFETIDSFFIVWDLSEIVTVDGFLVKVLANKALSIADSLYDRSNTVAVLISRKACSTILNFCIYLSILSLSMRLTNKWVSKIFLQCFSSMFLSWIALSAMIPSSPCLALLFSIRPSFSIIIWAMFYTCISRSFLSRSISDSSLSYTLLVLSSDSLISTPSFRYISSCLRK